MDPENNPWMSLLAKLAGFQRPPTKARQPIQQFMHECYKSVIKAHVEEELSSLRAIGDMRKNDASFRASVSKKLFDQFSEEKRKGFADCAKRDKDEALKKYKAALAAPYSTAPEDQQKFVFPSFFPCGCGHQANIYIDALTGWRSLSPHSYRV
jgi:hypothetical protein